MKGQETERKRIALETGCVYWDEKQELCMALPCDCLHDARIKLRDARCPATSETRDADDG